jgi:hypothetical protein
MADSDMEMRSNMALHPSCPFDIEVDHVCRAEALGKHFFLWTIPSSRPGPLIDLIYTMPRSEMLVYAPHHRWRQL